MPGRCKKKCCTPSCVDFADNFDRADSTSIGANWTEQAGDAEISGNRLVLPTDAIATYAHTTANQIGYVECKVEGDDGDKPRVILYTDSNNWIAVELEIGSSGKIRVIERASGSTNVTGEADFSSSADTQYTLKMCVHPTTGSNIAKGYVNGTRAVVGWSATARANTGWGVATGDTAADVTFDDFKLLKYSVSAPYDCEMGYGCRWPIQEDSSWGATNPIDDVKLTIAGMVDGFCFQCDEVNGEQVLTHTGSCHWELNTDIDSCVTFPLTFKYRFTYDITRQATQTTRITAIISGQGTAQATYRTDYDETQLQDESSLTLTKISDDGNCTYPSTITVDAVNA